MAKAPKLSGDLPETIDPEKQYEIQLARPTRYKGKLYTPAARFVASGTILEALKGDVASAHEAA